MRRKKALCLPCNADWSDVVQAPFHSERRYQWRGWHLRCRWGAPFGAVSDIQEVSFKARSKAVLSALQAPVQAPFAAPFAALFQACFRCDVRRILGGPAMPFSGTPEASFQAPYSGVPEAPSQASFSGNLDGMQALFFRGFRCRWEAPVLGVAGVRSRRRSGIIL